MQADSSRVAYRADAAGMVECPGSRSVDYSQYTRGEQSAVCNHCGERMNLARGGRSTLRRHYVTDVVAQIETADG